MQTDPSLDPKTVSLSARPASTAPSAPAFFARAAALGLRIPTVAREAAEKRFEGSDTRIIDGRLLADDLVAQCRALLPGRRVPRLAVVLAGEDPASHVYVRNKETMFAKAGFSSETLRVPSGRATLDGLVAIVSGLGAREDVDGILVQLPLPPGVPSGPVLAAIPPGKDVDGFLQSNMGLLALGEMRGALPCTPYGVMVALAAYRVPLCGARAVVVGRSNIVGKPMGLLLLAEDATVTLAHSRTRDLDALTREADILVAAAGRAGLVGRGAVKPGAVVVDVGMHRTPEGTLCGDVDADAVKGVASALTPVPGGVGPMTIAMLLVNTAAAAWSKEPT